MYFAMLENSLKVLTVQKRITRQGSNKLDTGFCICYRCSQKLRRQWTLLMFNELARYILKA
jgi:hypothetical protein